MKSICASILCCLTIMTGNLRSEEPRRRALLIGCTHYDNLPAKLQLVGPANDVQLFKRVLAERFGFNRPGDEVVTLVENADLATLPTKANIQREFDRLATTAIEGEFIFILMAGHGSQQPVPSARKATANEDDGLDELFLPRDIDRWDGKLGSVKNAITDNQINTWLTRMTEAGAHVWLVADHCHSGTITRGGTEEFSRAVPPGVLVPADILNGVTINDSKSVIGEPVTSTDESSTARRREPAVTKGGFAAIYASEPNEVTPELPLPTSAPSENRQRFGLLSFTVCEFLTQCKQPISYQELARAVQNRYRAEFRRSPTPFVEGSFRDRTVLGSELPPQKAKFTLSLHSQKGWLVDAGQLNGITPKTILEVHRPLGETGADQAIIGHVSVVEARLHESLVEPCAYNNVPAVKQLPELAECEVVSQEIKPSIGLTVSAKDLHGRAVDERYVEDLYAGLGQVRSRLVTITKDQGKANWELVVNNRQLTCLPRVSISTAHMDTQVAKFTLDGNDESAPSKIIANLERIVKARNLLRVADQEVTAEGLKSLELELSIYLSGKSLLPDVGVYKLNDGDLIDIRMRNNGVRPLDVTLLYVDAESGIKCLFPDLTRGDNNRLQGRGTTTSESSLKVGLTAKEELLEHLIVIAVPGTGSMSSFAELQQSAVTRKTGQGPDAFDSPLGKLLKANAFGIGTRGSSSKELGEFAMQCLGIKLSPRVK